MNTRYAIEKMGLGLLMVNNVALGVLGGVFIAFKLFQVEDWNFGVSLSLFLQTACFALLWFLATTMAESFAAKVSVIVSIAVWGTFIFIGFAESLDFVKTYHSPFSITNQTKLTSLCLDMRSFFGLILGGTAFQILLPSFKSRKDWL